jgi:hypothetical protein
VRRNPIDQNLKTAFKVEDYATCNLTEAELIELILETKQTMEV